MTVVSYSLFFMALGGFITAVYWNGFFTENRDPELPDLARRRNETFFITGVGTLAVATAVFLISATVSALL